MFDFANTSLEVIILILRFAVVGFLYLFLWQVLRAVISELRAVGQSSGSQAASRYGQLVVLRSGQSGVAVGKIFTLGPSNLIGRSMESCEIALNDTFLSQQHARLELRDDTWVIEDLRSTNGTFVNGIEVRDATVLEDGDILRFGRVELRLVRS
ncbi:MAG: FHA domain-containing protein [Roseiflexaceae bacterium]|nr:FHA domain-containing protein [Roseiflexaceae bacterium]